MTFRIKVFLVFLLVVIGLIWLLQNVAPVSITFLFWHLTLPLMGVVGFSLLLGFLIGFIVGSPWKMKKK